ncbi:hypothetical protein LZ480_01870 [Solibacillus sp. MA9]|uniref:Cell wall-binding protein n=1 Tax=Solibacillus palustris TaxID=2908203 RepID=A0ABS9U8G7_9BACL|nr:hypothetical protein [Solibacillus sp. MA9]MCH7320621.1 hypothetical protein [Solibacillus sp. MA9]
MKKNMKIGLMAGLLITPAVVAQAAPVAAEETTPASVNVENFLQAQATFLASTPPGSISALYTAVNKVKSAYNRLTTQEKAALTEEAKKQYDNIIATYSIAKNIDDLVKKTDTTAKLLEAIVSIETSYNDLGSADYQKFIMNYAKLEELKGSVQQVVKLENEIAKIPTTTEALTLIANIVTDSKGLSPLQRKYLSVENQALLTSWEQTIAAASNLIKEIDAISTTAFATWGTTNLSAKANTVKQFNTKIAALLVKLNNIKLASIPAGIDSKELVTNKARLYALNDFVDISASILELNADSARVAETLNAAKVKLATFEGKMTANANHLSGTDKLNLPHLQTFLDEYIKNLEQELVGIKEVEDLIKGLETNMDLVKLAAAREKYNALSAESKKFVSNASQLTTLENAYKTALSVVTQIEAIEPTAKDFANKVTTAKAAYDKLATAALKESVTNYAVLEGYLAIAKLMQDIDALRVTNKSFRQDYEKAKSTFTTLTAGVTLDSESNTENPDATPSNDKVLIAKKQLLKVYGPKLDQFGMSIATADRIDQQIAELASKSGESFMTALKQLSEEYKKLDSTIKSLIAKANELKAFEKDYNASLKVFNLIEQLPVSSDKQFSSKVTSAEAAYQRLTTAQKANVYNYNKLADVLKAATLISSIDKLRTTSKTFEMDVKALREQYEALSDEEKAIVHNIAKLVEAEESIGQAEKVIELINQAVPTAENYLAKLRAAREAYDKLDRSKQAIVVNAKELFARERAVKPILKLDSDILNLDPSNAKSFISKYNSAQKAYEKLSIVDRNLLENAGLLTGELKELYTVINAINSIKSSSKTFVSDTQTARNMYEALTPELKAKVSNYKVLTDHELNVAGGAAVDEQIRNLSSVEPLQFIGKVKEASEAYKKLSSSNKKAVTLIKDLQSLEKYIKPVEKVIDEIEGLSNPRNNLAKQFSKVSTSLQKLDAKQYSYITNMDKYSNLANVIHAYELIEKLKPSDKYYEGNLEAAITAYNKLSEDEKKRVTNYYKLQEAQLNIDETKVVINLIGSLTSTSSSYMDDVAKAAAAYKALPSSVRKQVVNYDVLKQAEKDIQEAQKVIKQIAALDLTAKSAESKVKSAKKAFEKLTKEQQSLVSNYNILQAAILEFEL